MTEKQHNLGYVSIKGWKSSKKSLYDDWFLEEEDTKEEVKNNNPSEVILEPNTEYNLIIDYPLSTPFSRKLNTFSKGMTKLELVDLVCRTYKQIYKEENRSTKVKEDYLEGTYNRVKTNGKYGIWGHHIGDLILCSAYVKDKTITLGVDS